MELIVGLCRHKEFMSILYAKTSVLVLHILAVLIVVKVDKIHVIIIGVLCVISDEEWWAEEFNPFELLKSHNQFIQLINDIFEEFLLNLFSIEEEEQ